MYNKLKLIKEKIMIVFKFIYCIIFLNRCFFFKGINIIKFKDWL